MEIVLYEKECFVLHPVQIDWIKPVVSQFENVIPVINVFPQYFYNQWFTEIQFLQINPITSAQN